jgi:hypothetical protein
VWQMARKLVLGLTLDKKYVFVGPLLKDGGWSSTKQDVTEDFYEVVIQKYVNEQPQWIHVINKDGTETIYEISVKQVT